MKYIIYNDLFTFFHKNKKIWLGYFLFLLSITILLPILGYLYDEPLFIGIMGLTFQHDGNYLFLLITVFHILFFMYLSTSLFTDDFKNDVCHLFLRMNPQKYLICKFVSITSITCCLKIIVYLLVFLYFKAHQVTISNIVLYFGKDFLYHSFLQYGLLCCYIGIKKIIPLILIPIIGFILIGDELFHIIEIPIGILIVSLISVLLLLYILYQKYYIKLFE